MLPSAVLRGEGEAESKGSPSPGPPEGRQDSRERSRVGEARGPSLVASSQKPHVSSAATLLCSHLHLGSPPSAALPGGQSPARGSHPEGNTKGCRGSLACS